MKTFKWLWSASVLALLLAGPAHAVEFVTGALFAAPGEIVACHASHFGKSDQNLRVELIEAQVLSSLGFLDCPLQATGVLCDTSAARSSPTRVFCKITASSKGTVRGLIQNITTGATAEAR